MFGKLCQRHLPWFSALIFWRRQLFRHSIFLSSFIQQIYIEQLLWARKSGRHFGRYEDESDQHPGRTQPPHTATPECDVAQEGEQRNVVLIKNCSSVSPVLCSASMGMTSPITTATAVALCPWVCHSTRIRQHQDGASLFRREETGFGGQ